MSDWYIKREAFAFGLFIEPQEGGGRGVGYCFSSTLPPPPLTKQNPPHVFFHLSLGVQTVSNRCQIGRCDFGESLDADLGVQVSALGH